ncbi:MAG: lysophospholipid acyltransferase family protein [Planctomycetaceae bacterium]|nr:lysophospholipid acyltransferase family protein [Planctomycetaceae bacterium]
MKIDLPILNQLGGLLGSAAVRWWMGTLDYKVAYYDRAIDPVFPEYQGQKIYVFWHEYILFPLYLRGRCNFAMLLSRHRDAEVLSYAAHHLGFEFVRGSTNRGGVGALRQLLDRSQRMNLTITPDGPRGPRRRLAPGCVYLASKLGLPLVAMGYGYDRPWRVRKAWDQFAIPRPFSRARAIPSGEIFVPPHLDREGLEHFRVKIEDLLNRLTIEAESWAASGLRKPGQHWLRKQPGAWPALGQNGRDAALPGIPDVRIPTV